MYERPSWAVPKDPQSRRTCLDLHFTPDTGHAEPWVRVSLLTGTDAHVERRKALTVRPGLLSSRNIRRHQQARYDWIPSGQPSPMSGRASDKTATSVAFTTRCAE
ncbi:hypothetical protein GCM10009691_35800 [Brevibacterium picturae]|uniref:Uncharacterized protein n=1 Tax=Brevibacterium picturae TaxID=260553 RepID=A0ABP4NCI6_9MICO